MILQNIFIFLALVSFLFLPIIVLHIIFQKDKMNVSIVVIGLLSAIIIFVAIIKSGYKMYDPVTNDEETLLFDEDTSTSLNVKIIQIVDHVINSGYKMYDLSINDEETFLFEEGFQLFFEDFGNVLVSVVSMLVGLIIGALLMKDAHNSKLMKSLKYLPIIVIATAVLVVGYVYIQLNQIHVDAQNMKRDVELKYNIIVSLDDAEDMVKLKRKGTESEWPVEIHVIDKEVPSRAYKLFYVLEGGDIKFYIHKGEDVYIKLN